MDDKVNLLYLPYKDLDFISISDTKSCVAGKKKYSPAANLFSSSKDKIRQIMKEYKFGTGSGKLDLTLKGEEYLAVYKTLPVNDWTVIVLIKKKELYSPLEKNREEVRSMIKGIYMHYIVFFLIILSASLLTSYFLVKYVFIKPVERPRSDVKLLGEGNFDYRIKEKGIREIFDLSKTFNVLSSQLKEYTVNLKQEIKDRQIMETELEIAGKTSRFSTS